MKKEYIVIVFLSLLASLPNHLFAQLDAKKIASDYYKGVVKILLMDSLAEKQEAGTGYIGRGSGFVVSEDGLVFTNRHVVDMCVQGYMNYDYYDESTGTIYRNTEVYSSDLLNDSNLVRINRVGYPAPIVQIYYGKGENDYKLYYAKVLSLSMGSFDGAMLKIISELDGKPVENNFQPLPIGNSDSTFQGEDLCVYGYPENYSGGLEMMLKEMSTLTFGKHSGFDYAYSKDFGYIKTEAAINKGNSGGPVFNQDNKVIGIATAAFNKTNIGLIGGINAMYYVAAMHIDILQKLAGKGLKLPKSAGAIKTVNGDHQPTLSQKEINDWNGKRKKEFDARMERIMNKKQEDEYKSFMEAAGRNKRMRVNFGIAMTASSYTRGNLDLFWQTINNNPSLTATGNGTPLGLAVDLQILGMDKKNKNAVGMGLHFYKTPGTAIAASSEIQGTSNKIELGLMLFNFSLVYSRPLSTKTFLLIDPSIAYFSYMKGSITAYGSSYSVKPSVPFGGGWEFSAGVNHLFNDMLGVSIRGGYRFMTLQEIHKDARDGYESSQSFFANGIDGETTMVKWSGFFVNAGAVISMATNVKRKGAMPGK